MQGNRSGAETQVLSLVVQDAEGAVGQAREAPCHPARSPWKSRVGHRVGRSSAGRDPTSCSSWCSSRVWKERPNRLSLRIKCSGIKPTFSASAHPSKPPATCSTMKALVYCFHIKVSRPSKKVKSRKANTHSYGLSSPTRQSFIYNMDLNLTYVRCKKNLNPHYILYVVL